METEYSSEQDQHIFSLCWVLLLCMRKVHRIWVNSTFRQKFIYVSFSNEISCWYSTGGKSPPVFGVTHSVSWQRVDLFIYSLFLFLRIHKTLKLYIILSTFWSFHPCMCVCYKILIQVKFICLTECLSCTVEIFIIFFCCPFERWGSFFCIW